MLRYAVSRILVGAGLLVLVASVGARSILGHSKLSEVSNRLHVTSISGKVPEDWNYDPWMSLYQDRQYIHEHIDHMFEYSLRCMKSDLKMTSLHSFVRITLDEQKEIYVVTVKIPGAKGNDIQLALDGRLLSISSQI